MAGLKELRIRIGSIKSTQKITSAMKMVAAARLRKAQTLIHTSEPYARNLLNSAARVLQELRYEEKKKGITYAYPKIMSSQGSKAEAAIPDESILLLVFSSDRGLCGGFNVNIAKAAAVRIEELKSEGKKVRVICVGRKAKDILKRKYGEYISDTVEGFAKKGADYEETNALASRVLHMFGNHEIDACEIITSRFISAITREIKPERILPLHIEEAEYLRQHPVSAMVDNSFYDYEPDKMEILENLLYLAYKMYVFQAAAHSQASEQGARMTSMDNATRNADEMIGKLTLKYNGIRQTAITTELIEIISGAEAL